MCMCFHFNGKGKETAVWCSVEKQASWSAAQPSKHLAGSLQCLQLQTQILRALPRQEHARRPRGQVRKQFYFSKSKKPLVASGGSNFFLQMQPVGPVLGGETGGCLRERRRCLHWENRSVGGREGGEGGM